MCFYKEEDLDHGFKNKAKKMVNEDAVRNNGVVLSFGLHRGIIYVFHLVSSIV